MSEKKPVVRFAPSPTGSLHVGGARTALYNWAYARGRGGRFLIRIEDTDRARSTEQAERGILADMAWLGLDWDDAERITRQSERLPLYNDAVEKLLAAGVAYEDEGAVRFRVPDRELGIHDKVLGEVKVPAGQVEDFVIRKGDGFPTYHLAVVVDDAEMGITHVIRGQEHLNSVPRHVALQEALGIQRPVYAHIPLIFNPDGSKMSKRDKAKVARQAAVESGKTSVEGLDQELFDAFLSRETDDLAAARAIAAAQGLTLPEIDLSDFRESGYLPGVLCNYLALLGWSPGDGTEKFDNEYLKERFDFGGVGKSPARFDRMKLHKFNADALQSMEPDAFAMEWRNWCEANRPDFAASFSQDRFAKLAEAYQQRSRTLAEPCEMAAFFLMPDAEIEFDPKAVKKILEKKEGAGFSVLAELETELAALDPWDAASLGDLVGRFASEKEIGMGAVAQPLRVAVTGTTVSPPIDLTLEILGREATLGRVRRCLALKGAATSGSEGV